MPSFRSASVALVALCLAHAPAHAQYAPPLQQHPSQAFRDTNDAAINKHLYQLKFPAGFDWVDGSQRYTALEPSSADPKKLDLVSYVTATGERTIIVPAARFVPTGTDKPLNVESYDWSRDKQQLLLYTNSQRVWRRNTRGDYWLLNIATGALRKLGQDLPASSLMFAKFSPDGTKVAYVHANNIYVEDATTGARKQLTVDGNSDIINGTTDWVTEEEFDLRDAFRWSPDSKRIAYWQFDQSGESEFTLINDTKAEYPETFRYKYPQAGTTNASVRAGVVSSDGGATRWLLLPGDRRNNYIPRMEWVGDFAPAQIALEYLDRKQQKNDIYLFNADSGNGKILFTDTDKAWLDVVDELRWLPSKKKNEHDLLWLSERDGWRHAYRITPDGKPHLITDFAGDVIDQVAIDESLNAFYFTASPDNATQQYLYRANLDGTGKPTRLTPASQTGFHGYQPTTDGKLALHYWSTFNQPYQFDLIQLSDSKVLKSLGDNHEVAAAAKPLVDQGAEFFKVDIGNGTKLDGWMIKPPNFDPTKKYPVLTYIYGEPASATVMDRWDNDRIMHASIAREGYIILSFENAGTPKPLGRAWRKSVYGQVGVLSSQQQAAAIKAFAKEHSFVDTTRMAIWGWSGGGSGTLNMMFRYPGLYRAGIAVAPVADERKYDTIYQERYMGLPQDNAQGYKDGSPITYAGGLSESLLIVHGSGDDNVHFQATELLINKLVELGKPFDFMDYPNRTHGIYEGPGTSTHLYNLIVRYLEDHVPAGAQ